MPVTEIEYVEKLVEAFPHVNELDIVAALRLLARMCA